MKKAVFFLVVFLLNTVLGFLCALGLEDQVDHMHLDTSAIYLHEHDHSGSDHHHSTAEPHQHSEDQHTAKKDKDDCCKEEVAKILKEDKRTPSKTAVKQPIAFITLPSSFFQFDIGESAVYKPNTRYFLRSHHPPIPDIRIGIQSFQI